MFRRHRSILFLVVLLSAGCGRGGDGLLSGLFGQAETPQATTPAAIPAPASTPETGPTETEPGSDAAAPTPETGTAAAASEPVPEATVPEPDPSPPPRTGALDPANTEALQSERVICEAKGGRWSRAGGGHSCVTPTRDANRACSSASQCQGYCLARSGTCSPVVPLFGCHEVISPSGGMQTICID